MEIRTIRVVLADDHRVVRHGIRGFLEEDPTIMVLAEADDGEQAVCLIEHHCPDVAVLDLQMPGRTGIEVARWVREQHLPVALLILTAYNDEPYLVAALEAGVNGYLLKSADAEEIVRAVHSVAQGDSVLDQSIVPNLMRMIAVPSEPPYYEPLSERELAVLDRAAQGLTNRAIALRLRISHRTVQGHLRHIYEKLGVANRTEAVVKASQLNLLRLPH